MQPFSYHSPSTVSEALALLAEPGARAFAGGTDLIAQLRERRRAAASIVDLKRIPELVSIALSEDRAMTIGAAVSATAVARHHEIAARYRAVAEAAAMIGSLQVQNRATLGGNICNAAPSADAVPPLIAHAAQAIVSGPSGEQRLPLEAVFEGPGRTSLAHGELLTGIVLPALPERTASHYLRFTPRREMDIAVAGVAAMVTCSADGTVMAARVALASVAPTPVRAPSAEAILIGNRLDETLSRQAAQAARADAHPISDTRGSADYRNDLVAVLAHRVLEACRRDLTRGDA